MTGALGSATPRLPWTIGGNDGCFWVKDGEGKRFGFTYYSDAERRSIGSGYGLELNRAEALRIVRNIMKLPELLTKLAEQPQPEAVEQQQAVEQQPQRG